MKRLCIFLIALIRDDVSKVPYLTDASGTMVLSYDDETSVGLKADYVKNNGLLGVSEGDISKDYELTYFSPEDWSMWIEEYAHVRTASSFRGACDYIKKFEAPTFALSVQKYLLSIGVKQQDIDDIRRIMLP